MYPVTEEAVFLEMLITLYQIMWHHIPEDFNFHDEFSENLKSRILKDQSVHQPLLYALGAFLKRRTSVKKRREM